MTSPSHSQSVAAVGDVIAGKYRVESTLGTGGMGIVFAATHLDLERLVAVKVMRAEMGEYPGAVERLLLEAKLAARFRSEHVCRVLDVGTLETGAPYIVMEYLEGVDLATLLAEQGAFDVETAADFTLQVCEALTEAHTAQIVHRDLKPENLFVARSMDGTPIIKVLDFGISKQVGVRGPSRNLTNPSAALGSPYYMAPEQMRSARDVDARADIWAVGAILFELLTARQAFQGESLPEVCANVMNSQPPRICELNPLLPSTLADVVQRCLSKDASLRFNDVGELAGALAPFGSPKSLESLERIERALTGKELGGARLAKDPTGRYRLDASSPRSSSKPGLKSTPTGPPLQVTLVDQATGGLAPATKFRPFGRWLLIAGVVGACTLGVLRWRAGLAREPRPSVAGSSPDATPLRRAAETSPPPIAGSSATASAAVELAPPTPPASAATAKLASIAARSGAHARLHPNRTPASPGPSAVLPAAASTPASAARKPNPAEAWDSSSFGPRR